MISIKFEMLHAAVALLSFLLLTLPSDEVSGFTTSSGGYLRTKSDGRFSIIVILYFRFAVSCRPD